MIALLAVACNRAPSDEQALAAIRAAHPELDTATVTERVWQDGPPWFSCAEVLVKLRARRDSAAVRDVVGNWRGLLLSGWAIARDSSSGVVTEPGWCAVQLHPDSARALRGWQIVHGPALPTGDPRRGWMVDVGRSRVTLRASARPVERDVAQIEFSVVLSPNANGIVLGSTLAAKPRRAVLRRDGGRWRMIDDAPVTSAR